MQEKDIKNILTDTYDFEKWHRVIDFVFPKVNFENSIVQLDDTSNKTKYIHQKGDIQLTDGKKIIILEVGIKRENKIAKTKVGFHNLTAKFIDQANNHGILVFYVSEDKTQLDYRLSLICKESRFNEDGTFEEFKTNPKRYSYLLGQNETGTTAAKRLKELAAKKNGFDFELKDVVDAFSVEKLNDEFFRKYKEQFQIFNNYLIEDTKVRYDIFEIDRNEKDTDKVVNELPIRDFTKKLLGRLVFLYFLQRKGWMGVITPPSGKDVVWKGGYADFIHKLFREAKHQSKFHSKYLTELFYNTLNNENRENFVFLIDKKSPFADGVNRSVPYLNGGLFDDDFPKGNAIDFPERLFENLFEFLEQYNFTIDENSPEDHEVGIDPEMLGHIFENLLEDNRDKGAYYTPKEVVHYMSQQSIIEYLNHNLNYYSSDVEEFIKANVVSDYIIKEHSKIEKLLKEVKVCDPAIGSGAFPMGVLKVIYTALHNLHNAINPTKKFNEAKTKKDIIQKSIYGVDLERGAVDIARLRFWLALVVDEDVPQPLPNLDYKIMQGNSILEKFEDVDLSSLLKEDTNNEIITAHNGQVELVGFGRNQSVFVFDSTTKEEFQSLLDLYFDFKVDKAHKYTSKKEVKKKINAIIEGKLKAKFALDKIKYQDKLAEKKSHLKANTIYAYDPKGIQDKKQKAIEKLNKEIEFLEFKIAHLAEILDRLNRWEHQEKERPYFLWHTYFKDVFDKGKFDIIIGNPPYIKEYTNKSAFDGIRDSAYYMGKMDIWYFFACICIDMLKDNGGIQCFIAQNNWITSSGAAKLRNKIVKETEMLSFIDFGNYKVFQSAGIQTMIYVVKKTPTPPTHYTTKYARLLVDNIDKTFLDYFLQSENTAQHENFEKLQFEFKTDVFLNSTISFNSSSNEKLLDIIESKSNFKISSEEIIQGIVGAPDKAFILNANQLQVLNSNEKRFVKKYYTGIDEVSEKYIIYLSNKNFANENLSDYPNLYNHFQPFKEDLIQAKIQYKTPNKPYFYLHRERDENFFLEGEKLICQTRSPKFAFYYTKQEFYASRALNILRTSRVDMQYLSALLNSKVMAFWYLKRGAKLGNLLKMDIGPLLNLPLIIAENINVIKCLYRYILLVNDSKVALIKYISNEIIIYAFKEVIDQAFYELYFGNEPELQELKVLQHLQDLKPISEAFTDEDVETVVKFYHSIQEQKSPIRSVLLKANIVSKDIVGIINATIS